MWINSEIISIGLVCLGSYLTSKVKAASDPELDRGFGHHYEWFHFKEGLAEAKNQKLPVMLIIHKSWCGACKALKPQFAASKEIMELSKHFIMINVMDDEEPMGSVFAPDGAYIPRILFLGPEGKVMPQYYNDIGNPSYKFFYSDPRSIVRSMRKVLELSFPKLLADEL